MTALRCLLQVLNSSVQTRNIKVQGHPDGDANGEYKLDTEADLSGWLVLKNARSDLFLRRDPKSDSWVLSRGTTPELAAEFSIANIEEPGTRDPGSLPVGAYDWTIRDGEGQPVKRTLRLTLTAWSAPEGTPTCPRLCYRHLHAFRVWQGCHHPPPRSPSPSPSRWYLVLPGRRA